MKSIDNKKAPDSWRKRSFSVVNTGILTMSNLTQNFLNPNNQPLMIGEFTIRQDNEGRYCLNDLHKASGGLEKHKPARFIRNQQTQDLISEIESESDQRPNMVFAIKTLHGGVNSGTYVVEDLVYSYAMWISAKFHLIVIRAYKMLVMQWKINDRQSISPEQQALLHEIVARRSGGERKIFAEMWARHNRHFKIPRYAELLAIHFPEAVHYLETMELKSKPEKQEAKPLIAMEAFDDQDVQYIMWYAPMLARLIFDDIVPALRALDSHKVGSLFGYTQQIAIHVNNLNRRAKEQGITSLAHVENRLIN